MPQLPRAFAQPLRGFARALSSHARGLRPLGNPATARFLGSAGIDAQVTTHTAACAPQVPLPAQLSTGLTTYRFIRSCSNKNHSLGNYLGNRNIPPFPHFGREMEALESIIPQKYPIFHIFTPSPHLPPAPPTAFNSG